MSHVNYIGTACSECGENITSLTDNGDGLHIECAEKAN